MLTSDEIAHNLTMVSMRNRYGIPILPKLHDGNGRISTIHAPALSEKKYENVAFEETETVLQTGYAEDDLFAEMVDAYDQIYE